MLSRPDGFMLFLDLGVDLFFTSELLHPNVKIRLELFRARRIFRIVIDNPNDSLGIVDCSLYTRRISLKDDYHKKRMDILGYTPVQFNYLETLEKLSSFLPHKTSSFRKTFSTIPNLSDCYCNEYKLCIHWILY